MTDSVTYTVCKIAKEFTDHAMEINADTKISEINMDSLEIFEFQMKLDEIYGVEVEVNDFILCSTVQDVVNLVNVLVAKK